MFIETYECDSTISGGIVQDVECQEESTYKISSRGQKGAQAVVRQSLKFLSQAPAAAAAPISQFENHRINFEFDSTKSSNDLETASLNAQTFLNDLCTRAQQKNSLDLQHANNFRYLVNQLESKTRAELVQFYKDSQAKCKLAG